MSILTTYFNLIKPQLTDRPDITEFDANWDVIDAALHALGNGSGSDSTALKKASNLTDVADAGSSRGNLHIPILTAVQAISTSNVASRSGLGTVDGVSLTAGQLILLTGQTTASQNGPWVIGTGAWTRPSDFATGLLSKSRLVYVTGGTLFGGQIWALTTATSITVDTDSQTWVAHAIGAIAESAVTGLVADLAAKAPLASPTFTGTVTVPTTTNATDAASKAYADAAAAGAANAKLACAVVSAVNTTLSGLQTIDTVTLVDGNRVLLIGQTTPSQNGPWVAHSGAWTRPTDYAAASVQSGAYVFVEGGTAAGNGYVVTGTTSFTVDSTSTTWTQFSGAGEIIAGTALTKTGNTLAVSLGTSGTTAAAGNDARFSTVPHTSQAGAYTFVLADAGTCVESSSATGVTFTIPTNATTAFPIDTVIEVCAYGAGAITIAGSGVTLRSPGNLVSTRVQYSSVVLRKRATDEWVLSGDLA